MQLIERYIGAVIEHLPANQRADIKKELESLIADMLEEKLADGYEQEAAIDTILRSLGAPNLLAEQYNEKPRYLIGPNIFDLYMLITKIVILSSLAGITISFLLQFWLEADSTTFPYVNYIFSLFSIALQAFAWVTLIFAIIQKTNPSISRWQQVNKDWKPDMLPPLIHDKLKYKPATAIVAIVFQMLFLAVLTFSPAYIGAFFKLQDEMRWEHIPFLNVPLFESYLPLIGLIIIAAIVLEIFKLIKGQWTFRIIIAHACWSLLSLAIAIFIFDNPAIWNDQFVAHLEKIALLRNNETALAATIHTWDWSRSLVIPVIIVITIVDLISLLLKYIQYKKS